MDAFDSIFAGKNVKASVRRKTDDGVTRSARLDHAPEGGVLTLEAFAAAAMRGAKCQKRADDRGVTLTLSADVSGAAARSSILSMADPIPAAPAAPPAAPAAAPENTPAAAANAGRRGAK